MPVIASRDDKSPDAGLEMFYDADKGVLAAVSYQFYHILCVEFFHVMKSFQSMFASHEYIAWKRKKVQDYPEIG